ncbi:MAG: hypothetical protein K8I27_01100 [Planctomycetes bacterium]|nr:hypothetical protein [Planctomycetota bacterium]
MAAEVSKKRSLFRRRKPGGIRIYPIQSFETCKERIVFDNQRMGMICNGQFAWQPLPPNRKTNAPWLPLTRIRT